MSISKLVKQISTAIVILLTLILVIPNSTNALTGADFNPGRIIDDAIFNNSYSMNIDQIQTFLNSKVPTCDRNHAGFTGTSGAVYSPPWTCLKEYNENPTTHENNIGRFNPDGTPYQVAGGMSSAQIIYTAAQTYSINPQVLIVLLQKEQSLVTDTWPASYQYRAATGYGCPDTAACDSTYYGFYNQVTNAARQFRKYATVPDQYNFKGGVTRFVQFSPTSSCGGNNVYIENQATASLYNYTPYQPNGPLLANINGGGNSCSAYGNLNFWKYFNSWFGSTYGVPFSWTVVSQTYTLPGGAEQAYNGGIPVDKGDLVTLKLVIKNTGNNTWLKDGSNPVRLATWEPPYRTSSVQTDTWISAYRAASLQETSVAPGENGTFIFTAKPKTAGNYGEYFNLVAEGAAWFPTNGIIRFNFNVRNNYNWQLVSQSYGDSDVTYTGGIPLNIGDSTPVTIKLKNTGDVTWHNDGDYPVRLSTWNPSYHESPMFDSGWINKYRPATTQEASVAPGEIGTFKFNLVAGKQGNYGEYFNLVAEGSSWFPETQMLRFNLNVPSDYKWQIVSQWYGAVEATTPYAGGIPVAPGATQNLKLIVKNTGNTTWKKAGNYPVRMATWDPPYRTSAFQDTSWISGVRVVTHQEDTVAPGQNATFIFSIKAPIKQGNYGEYFNLVAEGAAWFPTNGIMRFNFNVWQ